MSIITGTTGNDQLVKTSTADKTVGDLENDTISTIVPSVVAVVLIGWKFC